MPNITIIEDTREQCPLDFSPYTKLGIASKRAKLRTGDYSLEGFEGLFVIERKSLTDAVNTLTHGRKRFVREVYDRMSFATFRALVVEASWADLCKPYGFARGANPESIVNSLFALQLPPSNLHILAARNRAFIAWWIAKAAMMFTVRAGKGIQGMYDAIFDPMSANLAPLPMPKEVRL